MNDNNYCKAGNAVEINKRINQTNHIRAAKDKSITKD